MTKNRKKRVCVRLPVDMVLALKNDGRAMTAIIDNALFNLVHDIQTGRINNETKQILYNPSYTKGALISCQFRLNACAIEYLQFNGYNRTTCIKFACFLYDIIEGSQL